MGEMEDAIKQRLGDWDIAASRSSVVQSLKRTVQETLYDCAYLLGRVAELEGERDTRTALWQANAEEWQRTAHELEARATRLAGALREIAQGPTTPGSNPETPLDLARDVIACSQRIARQALADAPEGEGATG